jgi:hypothetical protein
MREHVITSHRRTESFLKAATLTAFAAAVMVGVQDRAAAYTKEQCKMQHDLNVASCKETFGGSDQLTTEDRYNCISSVNGSYLDCVAAASDSKSNAGAGGSSTGGKTGIIHSPPATGLLDSGTGLTPQGPAPTGGARGTRGGGTGTLQ